MEESDAVYYKKYRTMKKKLRLLVYEQESFIEELKKSQRKLLKISRDKSFLLDRLLQYEQARTDTSSDSESTASSDTESPSKDKKRKISHCPSVSSVGTTHAKHSTVVDSSSSPHSHGAKRKPTNAAAVKVKASTGKSYGKSSQSGPTLEESLAREEVERRLEMKQLNHAQFMGVTPSGSLPDDIFSHENSNLTNDYVEQDGVNVKVDDDDDDANLVIDMKN